MSVLVHIILPSIKKIYGTPRRTLKKSTDLAKLSILLESELAAIGQK
jgi:hypothetical protein